MKWLDQWLSKKMQQAWNNAKEKDYEQPKYTISALVGSQHVKNSRGLDRDATMQFRMHKAENGWIIELTGVDQKTDRHYSKLHIIGEEDDFDQSLCHIITVESLRS